MPHQAPFRDAFMDPDMRRLWQSMGTVPCGFHLDNPPIDEEAEISPDDLASIRRHAAYRRDHATPADGAELE